MATNEHPASMNALESSLSSVSSSLVNVGNSVNGIVGSSVNGLVNNVVSTNSSSATLLLSITGSSALLLTHFNDAASSGSTIYVYLGPDSTYPLFMQCSLSGGGCGTPLPAYVFSKTGWSVYGKNDGTNYTHIGYSRFSGWGQDSVSIIDCYDSYLNSVQHSTNYSTASSFPIYRNTTTNMKAILKFDLTSIPAGSTVMNACLSLCESSGDTNPDVWRINAILADWTLAEVSWDNRKTGTPWETAGASGATDMESDYSWQGTPILAVGTRFNFDLTDLVGRWVDGSLTNHGMVIYQYQIKSGFTAYFHSRQAASSTNYPQLLVDYV